MNTHTEVDRSAGEGAPWTASTRNREEAAASVGAETPAAESPRPIAAGADRVSVDPLRTTDRYRLVLPLPLEL